MPKVAAAIRLIERDGWALVRQAGSHRQYRHPSKPGTVTIPGRESKDLPPGTWNSIPETGGPQVKEGEVKYVVVYERTPNNWAAYVPDLPGCVAVGDRREDVKRQIREAMALHLDSLREFNEPVPRPGEWAELVAVGPRKQREPLTGTGRRDAGGV